MKILVDELYSPAIVLELRRRGHDAISAQEPEHRARYGNTDDNVIFARAQEDGRTVVTDNIADYEEALAAYDKSGEPHHGVIYTTYRQFDRSDPRVISLLVAALDAFLNSDESLVVPFNRRHYLRRA